MLAKRFLLFTVSCGLMLAAGACHRTAELPDVFLVTIDTLRADHCSVYGYPVPTTPILERLAVQGVLFRTAYSPTSTTAPSHAAMLTSRHPRSLGVLKNGHIIADEDLTLAEVLGSRGYQTAAFVSSLPLRSRFGFSQGFDAFDEDFVMATASLGRRKGDSAHDRIAAATVDRLEAWLSSRKDRRPLFVWLHLVDPHAPYRSPQPFRARWPKGTRGALRRYDSEVHYADKQLGRALDLIKRGQSDEGTIVVVASDHGEGLGDHGWVSHGVNLYEEAVRIPMLVSWPGHLKAGAEVAEPVTLIDIAPTVLALLGFEAPAAFDGKDMLADLDASRPIYLQRRSFRAKKVGDRRVAGPMSAVVESGRKYISAPEEKGDELYDLTRDPRELDNTAAEHPDAVAAMSSSLDRWRSSTPEPTREQTPLSKEDIKALRALGYVD